MTEQYEFSATASVSTTNAARYAKQLVSHWGRHAETVQDDADGTLMLFAPIGEWEDSAVRVRATPTTLVLTTYAHGAEALSAGQTSLEEHLRRWAAKQESLSVEWS